MDDYGLDFDLTSSQNVGSKVFEKWLILLCVLTT